MALRISFSHCPCCGSSAVFPVLSAKDYTVSQETFEIWHCDDCSNRFTQGIPDAAGIGPYYQSAAYVSHSDTQKGFINRLYHIVRNHTLSTKRKMVEKVSGKKNARLLEVGAGTGAFAHTMKTAGWEVTGLEPDPTARNNAKNKYDLELLSPELLFQLDAARFDVVSLWHVLEHVHELQAYWDQFYRLLKPGGCLIIAVPNYTSYDATHYKEYWAAYDVPRHLYHFSPKGMKILGHSKGFVLESSHPMWFDSFYVSMLSEQYKNGSANLFGAVWTGTFSNLKTLVNRKKGSSLIYIFRKK